MKTLLMDTLIQTIAGALLLVLMKYVSRLFLNSKVEVFVSDVIKIKDKECLSVYLLKRSKEDLSIKILLPKKIKIIDISFSAPVTFRRTEVDTADEAFSTFYIENLQTLKEVQLLIPDLSLSDFLKINHQAQKRTPSGLLKDEVIQTIYFLIVLLLTNFFIGLYFNNRIKKIENRWTESEKTLKELKEKELKTIEEQGKALQKCLKVKGLNELNN